MNKKNRYRVVIEKSDHNNWLSAEANRDALINQKYKAYILYRGHIVTQDVKKIKTQQEGI